MHVVNLNLRKSPRISQRAHIRLAGGGGGAVQFAWGHRRSQKFQTEVYQMLSVACFFSESTDTSLQGWTGTQTTLNDTYKTKTFRVMFILSDMQITKVGKELRGQILTDLNER